MRRFLFPALIPTLFCLHAQESLGTLLLRARTQRDAGNLNESLQAYDAMLSQVADHETAMLERAQVLSWMGRYDEAKAGNLAFKTRYPGRGEIADLRIAQVEAWSDQLEAALSTLGPWVARENRQAILDDATYRGWRGDSAEALKRLEVLLKRDPYDRDTLLLQSRILGWQSKWKESRKGYLRLLSRDARDGEALMGLSRVALWLGNVPLARTYLESLRPEDRANPDGRILEAQIVSAEGHPRRARTSILPLLQRGRSQRDARSLMDQFIDAQGWWIDLRQVRTDTNEGLSTQSQSLTLRAPILDGCVDLDIGRNRAELSTASRSSTFFGMGLSYPLASWISLGASISQYQDFGGRPATTNLASATLNPLPGLSFQVSTGKSLLDFTPQAISQRGSMVSNNLSATWTLGEGRHAISTGVGSAALSAGITRSSFFGSYEFRQPWSYGQFSTGAMIRGFGYSESLPLGFFNPERYRYAGFYFNTLYRRGHRLEFTGHLRGGLQQVNEDASQFAWGYGVSATWKPDAIPLSIFGSWSQAFAGLPVVAVSDPKHYRENTLTFGIRLTQPRAKVWF